MPSEIEQCGKVRWIFQKDAQAQVVHMKSEDSLRHKTLGEYKCPRCGFWHIGHNRRRNGASTG